MHRILFLIIALSSAFPVSAQRPGDEWVTRRGDETPGLNYTVAVTARNNRTIALGSFGNLMISDNGGTSWRFSRIEIGGERVFGAYNALYQVPGGSLIAVMRRLERSNVGLFDYTVRSFLVTSQDNGETWSLEPFPVNFATFPGSVRQFHGVDIENLTMSPGGELLAYGTISGTNNPGLVLWRIGGVIFRRSGNTWVQAFYGNGPVSKIAEAGGRAVAAVHNGVLDSADGAGWNGYTFPNAQFTLDGEPIDDDTQRRMRILDIEVIGGTYIAQGATFLPFRDIPGIDSNIADGIFKLSSPTPFSGARNWSAFTEPTFYGPFTRAGGQILSAGFGGVYSTASGGPGFTLRDETVTTTGRTLAVSGATVVAVGNSESAWRSIDGGDAWTQVWDEDPGPDLRPITTIDGTVFAQGNSGELWTSSDSGESWQLRSSDFRGFNSMVSISGGRLLASAGSRGIIVSDDGGVTWTPRFVAERVDSIPAILRSSTGRLIAPARGNDGRGNSVFYTSDDDGDTWTERNAGLGFGEQPAGIAQTQSGRLIVPFAFNLPFFPKLNISDDDGETWRASPVLQRLEGLDCISNQPESKTLDIEEIVVSTTGRILISGDDEIITSDDDGETWTVRANLSQDGIGGSIRDIIQAGSRWVAISSAGLDRHFTLISDDDGSTWGRVPFETNQPNTFLSNLALDGDGRVIITGGNGSVFTSDFDVPLPAEDPEQEVREGNMETVTIPRPDVDGMVEARYGTISRTAIAGTDFAPSGGMLTWEADDVTERTISIQTIDNLEQDSTREFLLQLTFETSDGILGTIETPVAITDDDEPSDAGLLFDGRTSVRTSETGDAAEVRVALDQRPTADVTITISGLDPTEGQLSTTTLTFTPDDSNIYQTFTLTGIDDPYPDGDCTYDLRFDVESTDPLYTQLGAIALAATNVGDEPYIAGGELFERLGAAYLTWIGENEIPTEQSGPFMDPNGDSMPNLSAYAFGLEPLVGSAGSPLEITSERTVTFRVLDSAENLTFTSQINPGLEFLNWVAGPDPVAGASTGGFTNYTVTIPADSDARFARILVGIEN